MYSEDVKTGLTTPVPFCLIIRLVITWDAYMKMLKPYQKQCKFLPYCKEAANCISVFLKEPEIIPEVK